MASRTTYTDDDKAKVFVVLQANEGNVKRTSRETGVPENTVRRWKTQFAEDGPPDLSAVEEAAEAFLDKAERVRTKALDAIELKIDSGSAKVSELNVTVGILTDKIDRAKGLALGRVDHVHSLPSPEDLREALGAAMAGAIAAARQREEEIIDAEIIEEQSVKELPASTS